MPRQKSHYVAMSLRELTQALLTQTEDGSIIRDIIRERMARAQVGYLYDLIMLRDNHADDVVLPSDEEHPIREFAKKCIEEGYWGQDMRDPVNAELFFHLAAKDDSDVDEQIRKHEPLERFWKAAAFGYEKWKMKEQLRRQKEQANAQR